MNKLQLHPLQTNTLDKDLDRQLINQDRQNAFHIPESSV